MYTGQGKPDENRIGDWLTTFTGQKFYPLDPRADDVRLLDIAHGIGFQSRFTGQTSYFYSIAQHSCLVAEVLKSRFPERPDLFLWGLFHDAAEAYIGDIPRPLKQMLNNITQGGIKLVEERILKVIAERFDLPWPIPDPDEIKKADNIALLTEAINLCPRANARTKWNWPEDIEPLPYWDWPSLPAVSMRNWLHTAERYLHEA